MSPDDIADGDPFVDLGLDEGTAENLYVIMEDCTGGLFDVMFAELDAETADCVKSVISEEDFRQVFLDLFQGMDGTDSALDDAFTSCMGAVIATMPLGASDRSDGGRQRVSATISATRSSGDRSVESRTRS